MLIRIRIRVKYFSKYIIVFFVFVHPNLPPFLHFLVNGQVHTIVMSNNEQILHRIISVASSFGTSFTPRHMITSWQQQCSYTFYLAPKLFVFATTEEKDIIWPLS